MAHLHAEGMTFFDCEDSPMIEHTPGPWAAAPYMGDQGREWQNWVILDAEGHGLATIDAVGEVPAEVEANALLIAAAPELLEALQAITGRLESAAAMLHSLHLPAYALDAESIIAQARAAIAKATEGGA